MVLKRKRNPIAMYSKKLNIVPPKEGVTLGYDLIEGDYVKPYGGGEVSDLIFTVKKKIEGRFIVEYDLSIEFSNPSDGLMYFYVEHEESKFQSDYKVPKGSFKDEWNFYRNYNDSDERETNLDRDRSYYFRVRSKVDEDGIIQSAHYGKIYGEFPRVEYYINPTPNDRNVEFNTAKNLFDELDYVVFKP